MRLSLLFLVLLLVSGGCIGKTDCVLVNKTVNLTEVSFERIPRTVSERYVGMEPYLDKRVRKIPLDYKVVHSARITKEHLSDEYGYWIEYGRLDQDLNGTVIFRLENNDSVNGSFTINLTLIRGNSNFTKSVTKNISSNSSEDYAFNFDLVRGRDWTYRFQVIPSTRDVEVSTLEYRDVDENRNKTVYEVVRLEVVKAVVRQVEVC
ncbi:MAG: hypothetical protein ABH851_04565 [Methanobacteriota archaeon]